MLPANTDFLGRDPAVPDLCGKCQNWGEYAPSGRGVPALGMCYVRRGEVPVYTTPIHGCDVQVRGVTLFRPFLVVA